MSNPKHTDAIPRKHRTARTRQLSLGATAIVAIVAVAMTAFADARTDYLVRALRTSDMFRVRAQAAASLGRVQAEPAVIQALTSALSDRHPAVRAAAASSLERHGDPAPLPQLRRATRDRESAVRAAAARAVQRLEAVARSQPRRRGVTNNGGGSSASSGPARFYVAVGTPGTKVRSVSPAVLRSSRDFIAQTVSQTRGVRIAPANERRNAAARVLRDDDLVGYYLDVSITSLGPGSSGGTRAAVSVILQTYPDRNIRSMLSGAATVMGASGSQAQSQAIQGALRGALRNLPQAMEAGARSARASASGRRRR
ncbi:MAG: HEAT repeat domain-containing protein [Sandaracinaceae bacterium]